MIFQWYGTASVSFHTNNSSILIDPFLPMKGSEVPTDLSDYQPFQNILVTHGHFDHIASLPQICRNTGKRIYATKGACRNLLRIGLNKKRLHEIHPGQCLRLGDFKITVFHSAHVKFDRALVRKTLMDKSILMAPKNLCQITAGLLFLPERDETVGYLIEADGIKVFLMGSLALRKDVIYPSQIDYLILPYQGNSHLLKLALDIIKQIQPKHIILDHFDDTFPPISKLIDTRDIQNADLKSADGTKIDVIRPAYKAPITL